MTDQTMTELIDRQIELDYLKARHEFLDAEWLDLPEAVKAQRLEDAADALEDKLELQAWEGQSNGR